MKKRATKLLATLLAVLMIAATCASFASAANSKRQLVFIGDSRTCWLHSAQTGTFTQDTFTADDTGMWSAIVSCQYSFMKNILVPRIEFFIPDGSAVIFWMGVNDILAGNSHVNDYIAYYNQKAADWKNKGVQVYVMGVGPKGSNKTIDTKWADENKQIRIFNKKLKKGLSSDIVYLDTYSFLKPSFGTTDDLHYTDNTSRRVYSWVAGQVK